MDLLAEQIEPTITGQIELSWRDAWRTELRGKGGEWTTGGTPDLPRRENRPPLDPPEDPRGQMLTEAEGQAMQDYISAGGAAAINGALRSGREPVPRHAAEISALDQLISEHTTTADTQLYRGMAVTPQLASQLKPGAVFTDKGFTSTTTQRSQAREYAHLRVRGYDPATDVTVTPEGGTAATMIINVPAGSHMAPGAANVGEYVLPRGGRYRVDRVTGDGSVIEVSLVG